LALANAGLAPGETATVSTVATSGIEVVEADKVTLIYDAKGKPGKDSFFEAYVKEVLGELAISTFSSSSLTHLDFGSSRSSFRRFASLCRTHLQWSRATTDRVVRERVKLDAFSFDTNRRASLSDLSFDSYQFQSTRFYFDCSQEALSCYEGERASSYGIACQWPRR